MTRNQAPPPRAKAAPPRPARPRKPKAPPPPAAPTPAAPEPISGHGGARTGAGRKRASLPQASLDALGQPPRDSPLLMARWWSKLLAELGWLVATGEIGVGIVRELKALAGTAGRLVPEDLRAEVDRYLRSLEAATKPDAQGPKPEEPKREQPPLRPAPR